MSKEFRVTFQPSGRSVFVLDGTILLEAAARAGLIIETPCGGAGKCGKCLVRVTSGECPACDEENGVLGSEQIARGDRLACRCKVHGDLVVEVPRSSLFEKGQRILTTNAEEKVEINPAITKKHITLAPPSREDSRPDVERVCEAVNANNADVAVLRSMPETLRSADFDVTATTVGGRLVDLEPGDKTGLCYGIAFDIGTTTVVGTLVNVCSGVDIAVASAVNPQTSYGDDVVSRIKRCRDEKDGLDRLRTAILETVDSLISETCSSAGIEPERICEAVFAGNTTMQEILCGINPISLGEIPFVPAFRNMLRMRARDLPIRINPGAEVTIFPQIGGFVGGDTVAGIIATRMDGMDKPALLVDVGTNGEVVLANRGKLIATSVAAGPAFEGARITAGMRASAGAIEKVVINDDVAINVIGNVKPRGLCGTGLIDAVAGLLDSGVLDAMGRILGPDELPETVGPRLRERVVSNNGQYDFVLAHESQSATGEPVCLCQKDIRELQLANGAIKAGVNILLKNEGLQPSDLGVVMLAGAFGNFIRRKSALRIGMLPSVESERIRFVGNTASFGAKMVLLSEAESDYARRVGATTEHLDLSLDPAFQIEFGEAMLFPGGT